MIKRFMPILGVFSFLLLFNSCGVKNSQKAPNYVFAAVSRGTVEKIVSSSGRLEPVSSVNVLAQMSGVTEKVYADYNDHVERGQTLAVLNTEMLQLELERQKASLVKAQANYDLQLLNYTNQLKLAEKNLVSDYDLKSSKTSLDVYTADLAATRASLRVTETEINQYAYIKSPITGIILNRALEEGQNVVEGSSSNSTALFTVAEDLQNMRILATVDELDIASIHADQMVRFTVEAFPQKSFTGRVSQVRLIPATKDNVVNYSVVVTVDNTDGSLLPGMTTEAEFVVARQEYVLSVPNAALRYEPSMLSTEEIETRVRELRLSVLPEEQREAIAAAIAARRELAGGLRGNGRAGMMGGMPMGIPGMGRGAFRQNGGGGSMLGELAELMAQKTLWYMDANGKLEVLLVSAGISDGSNTVISCETDIEGLSIIVRENIR